MRRERAKNFEVEDKKAKEDQELAWSSRQEAVETFAEIRARKIGRKRKGYRAKCKEKSRGSGSEIFAYLKQKIKKEAKLKEQELELRIKELELQEKRLQLPKVSKINL